MSPFYAEDVPAVPAAPAPDHLRLWTEPLGQPFLGTVVRCMAEFTRAGVPVDVDIADVGAKITGPDGKDVGHQVERLETGRYVARAASTDGGLWTFQFFTTGADALVEQHQYFVRG